MYVLVKDNKQYWCKDDEFWTSDLREAKMWKDPEKPKAIIEYWIEKKSTMYPKDSVVEVKEIILR